MVNAVRDNAVTFDDPHTGTGELEEFHFVRC
jgi:hypothetical protein